jgi:hypothetical protein
MPVLKEFRCAAHGPFEGFEAKCPRGCSPRFVVREFRSAPAFKSAKTKHVDRQFRAIAKEFGLTNLKNDPKSGTSVMQELRKGVKTPAEASPRWMNLEHAPPGFSRDPNAKVPVFDPSGSGFQPTEGALAVRRALPKPRPRVIGSYDGK